MASRLSLPPPSSSTSITPLEKRASETSAILPNGGDSSPSTRKQSRQSTFKSSVGSQENGNPRQRNRLLVVPGQAVLPDTRGKSFTRFDKFRRLSRAYDLRRLPRMSGKINYKRVYDDFARQSTIHGINHSAQVDNASDLLKGKPTYQKFLRYFWVAAFLICLFCLVIQVFFLLMKYLEYPKTVDLDLKFENAPFPSVTLCNLNPYKASAISQDASTKATIDAFQNILGSSGRDYGVAAALAGARLKNNKRRRNRQRRQHSNESKRRRYHQVYAQCYCELNKLSGERKKGSCFAAYKGKISLSFAENVLHNFHPSKCICQLDAVSKTLWPCFPYNTWKERLCTECPNDLGHCSMKFYNGSQEKAEIFDEADVCLCHNEYNHCVANNENGEIPEIIPTEDIEKLDYLKKFPSESAISFSATTTTTTTQAPAIREAMGFDELKDEIAISTQARQNLMFAVGEKPLKERVALSQSQDELILKCSFNQRDCDIKKDFKLHYDQTYGNCFTFNWNRTTAVTSHRAGANYGLRILLYANVSEYLPTSEAVGFRVTIHDKWIVPFPDAFGHSAPTGFMSSFGVRMKQFHRISAPHGHCLDGGEKNEDYIYKGFNYSVEGCHRSCTQREVVRVCGCADPMYPLANKKIKTCSVSDPTARNCIKNTTEYLGRLIAEGHVPNCTCHQPCNEIGYEVSYSAARWPSGTTKLMECDVTDDLCMEKYRKNAAMIQVFYEELNYETLTETPAYTISSLLADLGGVTGLWIGASIVSLLELLVLGFYCCQAYQKNKKHEEQIQQTLSPPYKKTVSISSSSTSRPPKKKSSSSKSQISRHSILDEIIASPSSLPTLPSENEASSESEESVPRKYSSPYLPPGADLPCICLFDMTGRIKKMKALCPEHGYMVRRGTGYSCGEDDDEEEEENEEGEMEGDWED